MPVMGEQEKPEEAVMDAPPCDPDSRRENLNANEAHVAVFFRRARFGFGGGAMLEYRPSR